jgi:hypothetical protein
VLIERLFVVQAVAGSSPVGERVGCDASAAAEESVVTQGGADVVEAADGVHAMAGGSVCGRRRR